MIKRETIGKIEIVLAIVIIVATIFLGIFYSSHLYGELSERANIFSGDPTQSPSFQKYSNETKTIIMYGSLNLQLTNLAALDIARVIVFCSAVIIIIISLFILLEGINKLIKPRK